MGITFHGRLGVRIVSRLEPQLFDPDFIEKLSNYSF